MKKALLIASCLALSTQAFSTTVNVTDSGFQSSYFCLNNQLYNGIPKYCGATGTYTHKHIPVAVEKNGHHFEVFSDNVDGDLNIYLVKDYNTKVFIHTIENWNDPHMNASVDVNKDGYVYVQVSARGVNSKRKSGHLYKSTQPYGVSMIHLKGEGSLDNTYFDQAYPQLHYSGRSNNRLALFTRYELTSNAGGGVRTLWVDANGVEKKLVEGGHYSVSDTNDDGEIYLAYNYHPGFNLNKRSNIHVIKSYTWNPNVWYTMSGQQLTLPIAENDPSTLVYDSEANGTYVYLKDIVAEEHGTGGGLHVLFTESSSYDPTTGVRHTKELDISRSNSVNVHTFGPVNHNYSAAAYLTDSFGWAVNTVLMNGDNGDPYFGGDIKVYKKQSGSWQLKTTYADGGNYGYIRQVRGASGKAVASKGQGATDNGNTQIRINVN